MDRPSRSDVHLSKEEEEKIEEATRGYFDGLAPKRHTKPQRSDYSSQYTDVLQDNLEEGTVNVIPEYVEFQNLEHNSQKLVYGNSDQVAEEFVETEYYSDLNGIDKQHHTTGSGFIRVEKEENPNTILFKLDQDESSASTLHVSCKGNPATNEWTPAARDDVAFVSDKPHRSDN